ncbi:MAG: hypothetical protein ACLPSW_19955 [Roseiarcus sp.]
MANRRAWKGEEWQEFALQLVQRRHGPQNVQIVPDSVGGDAGIEFFTTSGCLYQCYAPEEVSDVKKAASAMKAKASRDLPKLQKNQNTLAALLCGIKVSRWILLCPFLDNKEVVADIRKRGLALKSAGLPFLAHDFEALCHSQDDFAGELEQLKSLSLGPSVSIEMPSASDVSVASATSIGSRIDQKLSRAFGGGASAVQIGQRRDAYVKAHLYRENALDQLRQNHSVLWERAFQSLEAEETRLIAVGAATTLPAEMLQESTKRIEDSLVKALPTLSTGLVTQIALGTVSDWLIRCPLDFPEKNGP